MARTIVITAGQVTAEAQLNDSKTARAIWDALPIEAKGETWGDEIYFDIGLTAAPESPKEIVEAGDLGIRPASAVNVVGRIVGDPKVFKAVRAGTRVTLRRAS